MSKIKATDLYLLAAKTPCAPNTVARVVNGQRVRPAIESRIRDVARELKIELPEPVKSEGE